MKHDKHDMQPTVSARRRLIRGAFAAPALLTLHSGSARAASSLGMCLVKANTSPATFAAASADDNTFRYQLHTVRDSSNNI